MVRKTVDEQRAELETKKKQIEERLKGLNAVATKAKKKAEDRKKIVLGALVIGASETSPRHRDFALSILRAAPQRPQDQAVIAALITDLEATQHAPIAPQTEPLPKMEQE